MPNSTVHGLHLVAISGMGEQSETVLDIEAWHLSFPFSPDSITRERAWVRKY